MKYYLFAFCLLAVTVGCKNVEGDCDYELPPGWTLLYDSDTKEYIVADTTSDWRTEYVSLGSGIFDDCSTYKTSSPNSNTPTFTDSCKAKGIMKLYMYEHFHSFKPKKQ